MPINSAGDNVWGDASGDTHQLSGSLQVSGSVTLIDSGANSHKVGIGTTSPYTALSVVHDYHNVAFESQLDDGQGGGDILKYNPGTDPTLTLGQVCYLTSAGIWAPCDADAVATGGSQLLGIAMGTSPRTHGMLLRGFVQIPSTEILNLPGSGACDGLPVYVSTTAGHLDFTAPSGNNDYVRIVGYAIDDDNSDVLIYFNPSSTWVVVSA